MEEEIKVRMSESQYNVIRIYKNNDDNRTYFQVVDLIGTLLDRMSREQRKDLIDIMLSYEEINEALADLISGANGDETNSDNSADVLRKKLLPHADKAARQLIENLVNDNLQLTAKLSEQKSHISKILDQWPDAYKKYIPKADWVFSQSMYLDDGRYRKLLEYVESKD